MADVKITALTVLTAADPINDAIPIVDVSNPIMAASGTTSRISINNLLSSSPTATGALTVTGLVTAGSATITGDLTVDTSTLKVDSTNNRVIVGHTSGSAAFQVTNAGAAGLEIQPTGFSSAPLIQSYNRSGSAYTQLTLDASTIVHALSGTTAMTLNSTGNLVFPTGKGIDFSATSNSSGTMTSELLNDYEEGDWTIGLTFGGGSTGITTNANNARYTKIGRQVTVTGYLALTSKGSSTGDALITGLPFLINSYGGLSVYLAQITFADFPMGYSNLGTSTIPLRECTNAGVTSSLTNSDFANNSEIIFTMTYTVA